MNESGGGWQETDRSAGIKSQYYQYQPIDPEKRNPRLARISGDFLRTGRDSGKVQTLLIFKDLIFWSRFSSR